MKPLEDFHVARDRPDGRRSRCKACRLAAVAEQYAADPTAVRSRAAAVHSAYAARTPAEVAETRARLHPAGSKRCRKCGVGLAFAAFALSRYKADGLDTDCRACIAERNRQARGCGSDPSL
jgi:hypothetical protein